MEKALSLLQRISNEYAVILKENLVGIYVHGSLAFGCFCWENSDLDFLVVTNKPPTLPQKEKMIQTLLYLDRHLPPKGAEMSVVLLQHCQSFVHPTPFELHFSNIYKTDCIKDLKNYCLHMNGTDPDLAAHFTVVRKVGFPLYGKPVPDVFAPVPEQDYWASLLWDVQDAAEEIKRIPVSTILNLCRVLAFYMERLVISKEQGGLWGLRNLPAIYQPTILKALKSYGQTMPFEEDPQKLRDFASFIIRQIV